MKTSHCFHSSISLPGIHLISGENNRVGKSGTFYRIIEQCLYYTIEYIVYCITMMWAGILLNVSLAKKELHYNGLTKIPRPLIFGLLFR
jgi:hypothetical protein